ncbi:MAG: LVIVD repeat-containing protein, partial [Pseudomonadales bacterium]
MSGAGTPPVSATRDDYHGKYDSPEKVERVRNFSGLRGVRIFDATDPMNISLLSEWACDQGDPSRAVQTGGGTHRNYYSGGRYAYLDSAPDDSFVHLENEFRLHSNCIQTVDLSDPAKPKFVSNWWLPGQRASEEQAYQRWRYAGDRTSWTGFHGPMYVPVKVEDGGRYGYSSYGHFGVFIHDVSDPAKPLLVGKFDPAPQPGGIAFHTVDVTRLDRGIILASPETLNPDCNETWQDTYVLDVSDVTRPSAVSRLPIPAPPEEAPYTTFCNKRGRFGTHNPMHAKAP